MASDSETATEDEINDHSDVDHSEVDHSEVEDDVAPVVVAKAEEDLGPLELSEEEIGWAKEIKKVLMKENEELAKSVTDFEYAQQGIVSKGKTEKAIKRIKRLKKFRDDYGIKETTKPEAAMETIKKFSDLSPGFFLAFGTDNNGRSVTTWNYVSFLIAKYKNNPEAWKTCFSAYYYLFDAMNSDFKCMRKGCIIIADCKGLGWENFSLEMEKRAAELYQDSYPILIKEMSMLNSPAILKVMYALVSPFLSKKIKERFHMNAKLEDIQQRYPKHVLPISMKGSQNRDTMEKKLLNGLKKRFENSATFSL